MHISADDRRLLCILAMVVRFVVVVYYALMKQKIKEQNCGELQLFRDFQARSNSAIFVD
jgi:hypothetical protein